MILKEDVKFGDLLVYFNYLKKLKLVIQDYSEGGCRMDFTNHLGEFVSINFTNPQTLTTTVYTTEGMNFELLEPIMELLKERVELQIENAKKLIREHKDVN